MLFKSGEIEQKKKHRNRKKGKIKDRIIYFKYHHRTKGNCKSQKKKERKFSVTKIKFSYLILPTRKTKPEIRNRTENCRLEVEKFDIR